MRDEPDPRIAALKERRWREVAEIDAALAAGRIDERGWHAAMAELVTPAYLTATNPFGQAGHSGDAASWEESRGIIRHALRRPGTFLDGGCASGILMESVRRWGEERGVAIEPYGLEIVPALAELARARLPQWAARIFVGNVRDWHPPHAARFDYVLLRPEYAPPGQRRALIRRVQADLVAPDGRLIVFVGSEEARERRTEAELLGPGRCAHGRVERRHPTHPALRRRLFWIDRPRVDDLAGEPH
ncbi:MAG TPA: class I SAM-dependent methyltransferase [Pseudomonadales bacterium]